MDEDLRAADSMEVARDDYVLLKTLKADPERGLLDDGLAVQPDLEGKDRLQIDRQGEPAESVNFSVHCFAFQRQVRCRPGSPRPGSVPIATDRGRIPSRSDAWTAPILDAGMLSARRSDAPEADRGVVLEASVGPSPTKNMRSSSGAGQLDVVSDVTHNCDRR